jgi:hypothetical protein
MINQTSQQLTPQLVNTVQQLSTSLKAIQLISLGNSEKEGVYSELSQTTQLITYTLIATAIVGIFVYHYIKNQESN